MTVNKPCSQSVFAASLLDPDRSVPPGLSVWNNSDPGRRMAVYRNNVIASLMDALADSMPVVQQLVGEAFFRAMAVAFIRNEPPRTPVLAHYGDAFPAFVEAFEPARIVPYLADMARLELARIRSYHAANADVVSDAALASALSSGDRIAALQLVCHPSVSVVASAYSIVSLWAAHQVDGDMAQTEVDTAQAGLIVRQGLDVVVLAIPPRAIGAVTYPAIPRSAMPSRSCLPRP